MRVIIITCLLLIFGCKDKVVKEGKGNRFNIDTLTTRNDSVKNSLKYEIFLKYSNVPITHLTSDNTKFNEYPMLKQLDSLFDIYSENELSKTEIENLNIMKAKRYLYTSNFKKAITELNKLSGSDYKDLLLGISYQLKGDSLKSEDYLNKLYSKIKPIKSSDIDKCHKYLLMSVLLDKDKLEYCTHLTKSYISMIKDGKKEIIRANFLSTVEL